MPRICGTRSCYAGGCRCEDCRIANSEYEKIRRSKSFNNVKRTREIAKNSYIRREKDPIKKKHRQYNDKVRKLKSFGLTEETYKLLFEIQGNCCGLCRNDKPGVKSGWHTDHDHTTGVTRGILCYKCNIGLGLFGDNLDGLMKAIKYIEEPPAQKLK